MSNFEEKTLGDWSDEKNWRSFFNQYNEYLRNFAFSYRLPPQEVDDVVQETFISIARSFKEGMFDPNKGNIGGWITQIAKWRILDAMRRLRKENRHVTSGDEVLLENQIDKHYDFDSSLEKERKKKLYFQAVENLFQRQKNKDLVIFSDSVLENMSNAQIMRKYKVKASAIYVAKHRIIKKITKEVSNILKAEPNF